MKDSNSDVCVSDMLDILFYKARTYSAWRDIPVPDELLHSLAECISLGPTSANCEPVRLVFIRTAHEKERLLPCLAEGNRVQTQLAPITVIIGYDLNFYEKLPELFPYVDARSWFVDRSAFAETTAFRNSSLQGGYLILAARALGLDCGPMSGFNNKAIDEIFFPQTSIRSNFLCNLGYGEPSNLHRDRPPRLKFNDFCTVL